MVSGSGAEAARRPGPLPGAGTPAQTNLGRGGEKKREEREAAAALKPRPLRRPPGAGRGRFDREPPAGPRRTPRAPPPLSIPVAPCEPEFERPLGGGRLSARPPRQSVCGPPLADADVARDRPVMILPQVHLRKPCYDFYFL